MDDLRMYWVYIRLSIKAQWQYKMNFALVSVGVFLANILDILGMWALFSRFGAIPGWTLPEAMLLYGLVNVTFAFSDAMWRGYDVLGRFIRSGELDRMLLRPRPLPVQLLGYEFRINRVGRLAQGLVVLTLALLWLDIAWSPTKVLLLLWAMIAGNLLFGGMFVLQATLSFYSVDSIEVINAISYGGVFFSSYPMEVYDVWFRGFFTYAVPLAAVVYLPVCACWARALGSSPPSSGRWPARPFWAWPMRSSTGWACLITPPPAHRKAMAC